MDHWYKFSILMTF